jgi:hypothetical protein
MRNTLTLPMSRVNALAAETDTTPEAAISALLSVLHSRKMWAHFDKSKTTTATAVFVYGANVPTFRKSFAKCHPKTERTKQ